MKNCIFLLAVAVLLSACDDPARDPLGGEGEGCLPGDLCDGALVCVGGVCRVDGSDACGNGVIDPGEECDGSELNGSACTDFGYAGGAMACSDVCTLDYAQCEGGCGNGVLDPGEECDGDALNGETCETLGHRGGNLRCTDACLLNEALCMPQLSRINTNVDVLFVIDNSLSMIEEQQQLQARFSTLLSTLRQGVGYMPNIHIGVTTTDLGVGPYTLPSCESGGEGGRLIKGSGNACNNPMTQMFMVDVEPMGCTVTRDDSGTCVESDCAQANCDATAFIDANGQPTEPSGLLLVTDEDGCPRCVNYANETMDEVFSCMANVGTNGCGFEQPLEAMHSALTGGYPENQGFVRETAYLTVILVTDEDDCSASDDAIFNPDDGLHALTSFRCTRAGVACEEAWSTLDATDAAVVDFSGCVTADTGHPYDMLYHADRYSQLLAQVKGSAALATVTAIAGPYNGTLTVQHDAMGQWQLAPSCDSTMGGSAMPAVRIKELVSYYNDPADMSWAFLPICSSDYAPVLQGVGERVVGVMGY